VTTSESAWALLGHYNGMPAMIDKGKAAGESGWPGAGSNRRPSDFQASQALPAHAAQCSAVLFGLITRSLSLVSEWQSGTPASRPGRVAPQRHHGRPRPGSGAVRVRTRGRPGAQGWSNIGTRGASHSAAGVVVKARDASWMRGGGRTSSANMLVDRSAAAALRKKVRQTRVPEGHSSNRHRHASRC
jgi:hypothetical protein